MIGVSAHGVALSRELSGTQEGSSDTTLAIRLARASWFTIDAPPIELVAKMRQHPIEPAIDVEACRELHRSGDLLSLPAIRKSQAKQQPVVGREFVQGCGEGAVTFRLIQEEIWPRMGIPKCVEVQRVTYQRKQSPPEITALTVGVASRV